MSRKNMNAYYTKTYLALKARPKDSAIASYERCCYMEDMIDHTSRSLPKSFCMCDAQIRSYPVVSKAIDQLLQG
jgi:hypothetical protein